MRANDKMDRNRGWFSDDVTLRDGSVVNEGHKDIGFPVGGIAVKGGIVMGSMGGNIVRGARKLKNTLPSLDSTGKSSWHIA